EQREPVGGGLLDDYLLDHRDQRVAVAKTKAGIRIARIVEQPLESEGFAESLPVGRRRGANGQPAVGRPEGLVRRVALVRRAQRPRVLAGRKDLASLPDRERDAGLQQADIDVLAEP